MSTYNTWYIASPSSILEDIALMIPYCVIDRNGNLANYENCIDVPAGPSSESLVKWRKCNTVSAIIYEVSDLKAEMLVKYHSGFELHILCSGKALTGIIKYKGEIVNVTPLNVGEFCFADVASARETIEDVTGFSGDAENIVWDRSGSINNVIVTVMKAGERFVRWLQKK